MDPPAAQEEKEEERRAAAILELFSYPRSGPQSDDVLKLQELLFKSPDCANDITDLDEHARKALQLLTDLRLGKSGNTLIHVAARNGRADLLLPLRSALAVAATTSGRSAPADAKKTSMPLADVPNANGDTPLMFGAMGGFADVVACLLTCGVSATTANRAGMTALMCACCAGADQGDLCHLILKGLNDARHVNAQDINGNTALHFAAKAGHARCVSALLSKGAEITKRNRMNKVAQDAGSVARECVTALQRKWEELEAAAASAEKGLVKERKGAKRRLRQKQKKEKEGTKPQKKEQPSEAESGTVAHEAGPSSEEKTPPHEDTGLTAVKAREVIQGENERQNERIGGATSTAEAEQQQQQRAKGASPPTPAERPEVTRHRETTGQASREAAQKDPSVATSSGTARSSAVADQQQQQNREQSDQQRSAATAVPNAHLNANANAKAPFRYADAVAAAGKRPSPPGMPAPLASRVSPLPPKPGSKPATAAAAKALGAQKRAESTASRPDPATAASKELAQLRRMYEREKREKQELAASLEIMRKEKALVEVEKQLLARERDTAVERERAMDRQMRERHPQAESLALTHAHLLGSEYEDLSMEQISALQQIHSHALADLRTAMERLMVRQEQVLLEERNALQRELASLRTTAKTTKKNS